MRVLKSALLKVPSVHDILDLTLGCKDLMMLQYKIFKKIQDDCDFHRPWIIVISHIATIYLLQMTKISGPPHLKVTRKKIRLGVEVFWNFRRLKLRQ